MSDSEQDNSVLGKRSRNGQNSEAEPAEDHQEMAEDSDEDVGPMPLPAGAEDSIVKKKRKGTLTFRLLCT